jgi:peptidyl-prolyl cis-trans isomerase B (cyclophilin B)
MVLLVKICTYIGGFMKLLRISIILVFMVILTLSAFAEMKQKTFTKEEIKKMAETRAVIETKFGNIELRFFPDVAPNHVNNFIELAKKGFYDGTTFHRVIPGFMIQGGDPNSKDPDRSKHGMGGPGCTIKAEFNEKPHKRGTLSMARAASPDSAGSQFFICVADASFLNRQYTVFGEVVSGMDVADKIVNQPRDSRDNPLERIEMKVKVLEK